MSQSNESNNLEIGVEEVEYLSNLSRIYLTEEEKVEMAGDLSKIIDSVKKVNQIDTEGLEPLYNVMEQHHNFLRKDEPQSAIPHSDIERISENFQSGYFVVPQVIE